GALTARGGAGAGHSSDRVRCPKLAPVVDFAGSPVREALMRLEAEGFVMLEQNKGFRVAEVSVAHLEDLSRTRIEIEGVALRWAISNGGVEWESEIVGSMHRLASVEKWISPDHLVRNADWLRYHRDFHKALI